MKQINEAFLILEKDAFERVEIEKRMIDGHFGSLSKFELFIWDLEMFLQFQRKLGDKIILKGGAATQFYIPISSQRTSVDIDMICLATRQEVYSAIAEIENGFKGEGEYCKLRLHVPKNPKVGLDALETYYETVPSICNGKELFATRGRQEVKIEFIFSKNQYDICKITQPELFALNTKQMFHVLPFEHLFADKLTTLGPNTIGVSELRSDEQAKQIYDVITLFLSNIDIVFELKSQIKVHYENTALDECAIHGISYDLQELVADMKTLIGRLKNIENDAQLFQRMNDFQALYLRRPVNRDRAQWAIVGYQLDLLISFLFYDDKRVLRFREIEEFITKLKFEHVRGPERGAINNEVRKVLETSFGKIEGYSKEFFRKRIDRIIWELLALVDFDDIKDLLVHIIMEKEI